ncbi:AAA family ATPase [Sphaerisporangium sp. NPDC049003]|uniref:AAA family ATPase n=1 Tax=Sphaerisporangium sp. NPDC049003 TaxID=3364517 RepID=UPI0037190A59
MIIWINGPFGVGKTTTATLLHQELAGSILFDPEEVGFLLRKSIPEDHPARLKDFQDYPMWRSLVADTAIHLDRYIGQPPVIAPMTLIRRDYAMQIFDAIQAGGAQVHHLLIHADTDTIATRIESSMEFPGDDERSEKVRAFRRRKLQPYEQAYATWLHNEAEVIDTTTLTPQQVLEQALKLLPLW